MDLESLHQTIYRRDLAFTNSNHAYFQLLTFHGFDSNHGPGTTTYHNEVDRTEYFVSRTAFYSHVEMCSYCCAHSHSSRLRRSNDTAYGSISSFIQSEILSILSGSVPNASSK